MNWKNHLLVGSIVGTIVAAVIFSINPLPVSFNNWVLLMALILLSPLVCDLDHRNGKLKTLITSISIITLVIGIIIGVLGANNINSLIIISAITLFVINFTPIFFKHRGFIHSISFITIYSLTIGIVTMNWAYGLISFAGAWSHLWLDKIPIKIT